MTAVVESCSGQDTDGETENLGVDRTAKPLLVVVT